MKTISALALLTVLAATAFGQPQMPPNFSPAAAAAPVMPASPQEIDGVLCQADALLGLLDGSGPVKAKSPACDLGYSAAKWGDYIRQGAVPVDFAAFGNELVSYYIYQSLEAQNTAPCGELPELQKTVETYLKEGTTGSNWRSNCMTHYDEIRFKKAVITRSSDVEALCTAMISNDPFRNSGNSGPLEKFCQAVSAHVGDLSSAVSSICAGPGGAEKRCVANIREMSGDSSVCRSLPYPHQELCYGVAAFAVATRTKDPKKCGDQSVCWAMLGDARSMTDVSLRRVARLLIPMFMRDMSDKFAALDKKVNPLDSQTEGLIDQRAEALARLRLKFDPISRQPAPKITGKKPARASSSGTR